MPRSARAGLAQSIASRAIEDSKKRLASSCRHAPPGRTHRVARSSRIRTGSRPGAFSSAQLFSQRAR